MAYTQAWLDNTSVSRCIIVKVTVRKLLPSASEVVLYLSNRPYNTTTYDVEFLPIISEEFSCTERMSIDGDLSLAVGNLTVSNNGGAYDSWLDSTQYIWTNRTIEVYHGDATERYTNIAGVLAGNFTKVFSGVVSAINSTSSDSIYFTFKDKMERLNCSLTEVLISDLITTDVWPDGSHPNDGKIAPLVFGEVFNITPVLVDPATLKYMVNASDVENIIEIRDNGIPIYTTGSGGLSGGVTWTSPAGTFTLNFAPAGEITASVQGVKKSTNLSTGALLTTYSNKVANIIATIAINYGNPDTSNMRLTSADVDLTSFSAFDTANNVPVGLFIEDRDNMLNVCVELAKSVGAQLYFNRLGLLQILRVGNDYMNYTVRAITSGDVVLNSMKMVAKIPVISNKKIAYAKNWTVQSSTADAVPSSHKAQYAKEWLFYNHNDATVQSTYRLAKDRAPKETMLITKTDATNEATRIVNYGKVSKTVYGFTGTPSLLSLKLGQYVTLTNSRYGLNATSGQVIALIPKWDSGLIDVEVIV